MEEAKIWYTSKTIWFNLIMVVSTVASNYIPFSSIDGKDIDSIAAGIACIGNVILRFMSSSSVTVK